MAAREHQTQVRVHGVRILVVGQLAVTAMRLAGGKVGLTDGPFAESKEQVGGYALVEVKSREEALALAREFLEVHARIMGPAYAMDTEIREMFP